MKSMSKSSMQSQHFIIVQNKRYTYELIPINKNVTLVKCSAAHISQEFLNEDVAQLLVDLPGLILAEKNYRQDQTEIIRFRINARDKASIEKKALKSGYKNVSSFLRALALSK